MKKIIIILILFILISCEASKKNIKKMATQPFDSIEISDLIDNQKKDKLLVAILLPLSGKAEKVGNIMLNSAKLSMFESKLNNIILMPYDTKGTSFGAVDAINQAIRDNADIVIGPLFTQSTKAIIDIVNLNNLIMLSFSDNQALLNSTKTTNLYLMGLTPKQEIYRIISYLIDYQNFYGFSASFPNDAYGSMSLKLFKEVIFRKDAKIVKTDFYAKDDSNLEKRVNNILGTNTFRDEVYQKYEEDKALAKAEGLNVDVEFTYTDEDKIFADALLLPDSGDNLIKIANYVSQYSGTNKPLMIGTSKWMNMTLYNNPKFNNALFVAPNPTEYVNYEKMYFDVFASYPLRISTLAYDAVKAVSESYAKAQNKENLKMALENYQGFEGANGKFRFLSDGLLERRLAIIKIFDGRLEIIDYDNDPFLRY